MTAEEIKKHVDTIIKNTFDKLARVYENKERLIFPCYRDGARRISEQELRFVFTEAFIEYCSDTNNSEVKDWHYSIETPTLDTYVFKKGIKAPKGPFPRQDKQGESASFDFVIHDQDFKRICLIEFKAHKKDTIHKDYVKLIYDLQMDNDTKRDRYTTHTQCYFIEIVDNYDKGTLKKFNNELHRIKDAVTSDAFNKIRFRCYSLEKKKEITEDIFTLNPSSK